MIKSFRDKNTEKVFEGKFVKEFSAVRKIAREKLDQIYAAVELEDLKIPPGNRLKPLLGDRAGQYSIRVNLQYRICFEWRDGNAYKVELNAHYD